MSIHVYVSKIVYRKTCMIMHLCVHAYMYVCVCMYVGMHACVYTCIFSCM